MSIALYHVSDRGDIAVFEPRQVAEPAATGVQGPAVWAVDDDHLQNYLLPRDCPRVTYYALPHSDPRDVERLLGHTDARYVVAIERRWLDAARRTRLYLYHLPADTFELADAGAGYWVSHQTVTPLDVTPVEDVLGALLGRDVELRITPSLWKLRDAVVASTLQYSCIRMRNALPR